MFYSNDMVSLYHGDFLDLPIPSNFDLIVTSPPYNLDIKYDGHDDKQEYDAYLEFTRRWLAKCFDIATHGNRLCINIPLDTNKGGQRSVYAGVVAIAKSVGWKYHTTIVWNEQNMSRRTAWGSWKSASAPYVTAPVEMIPVFYKGEWKRSSVGRANDVSRDEFIQWTNGVWEFSGESKKQVGHPAPFPLELPARCIKLFSFVGDTVLDPFLGSGTTLLACQAAGRKCVGVELSREYCELARKRLIATGNLLVIASSINVHGVASRDGGCV